jgi:hypothetical protein
MNKSLYDTTPVVIEHFFTNEEFDAIYEHINKFELESFLLYGNNKNSVFRNVEDVGYCAFSYEWPTAIKNKIKNQMMSLGVTDINDPEIHFARYTTLTGSKPRLRPHFDRFLTSPHVTFSIQLKNTKTDWKIFVDDNSFLLPENSAIYFSGTNQIHFRSEEIFQNEDYCDVLVCQFKLNNYTINENHDKIMSDKLNKYFIFYETNVASLAD